MGNHKTQHKATREQRNSNRELAELKRENQNLKRKIARLQKQLQKAVDVSQMVTEVAQEETPEPLQTANCPVCSTPGLTHVSLPTGTLRACKSCGWRKKD